jgi:hypothetical protein
MFHPTAGHCVSSWHSTTTAAATTKATTTAATAAAVLCINHGIEVLLCVCYAGKDTSCGNIPEVTPGRRAFTRHLESNFF